MYSSYTITTLITLALAILSARAEEGVKYRQRSYEPHRTVESKASPDKLWRSNQKSVVPSRPALPREAGGGRMYQAGRVGTTPAPAPHSVAKNTPLPASNKEVKAAAYRAVPPSATERRPYDTGKSATATPYIPETTPKGKNPLLRPRQDIRERKP